jgi:hypothetical protein
VIRLRLPLVFPGLNPQQKFNSKENYEMRTILIAPLLLVVALAGCSSTPQQAPRNVSTTSNGNIPRPDTPLPDRAYKAEITLVEPLTTMKPSQKQPIKVKVKNTSDGLWIVYGTGEGGKYRVAVGNSWLDSKGQLITNMDGRYGLPGNLSPGRDVEVPLMITAPDKPGDYILQLDMVQEGVAWFQDKGSPVLKVNVRVQ